MSLNAGVKSMDEVYAICTYCDSHYLSRAIVAIRRLLKFDPHLAIHVLCFDQLTAQVLNTWLEERVITIPLADVHAYEPRLPSLREARKPWEFIATHKAAFMAYVLNERGPFAWASFIDSDTAVYHSLNPIFNELSSASIGLSPHRFVEGSPHARRYGVYNAGFLCFRNDENAQRCLEDWTDDCINWCHATVLPDGRFMNQGYLTRWPRRYQGVKEISHPGVNLAPWNLARHQICFNAGNVQVDGSPLIFFHFSGLRRQPNGSWSSQHQNSSWQHPEVNAQLYQPYTTEIDEVEHQLLTLYGISGTGSVRSAIEGLRRSEAIALLRRGWAFLKGSHSPNGSASEANGP